MTSAVDERTAAHDFDFLMGRWTVHNRYLKKRGSDEWEEFEATSIARPLLDGLGNEDEFRTDHGGGFIGMAFRFHDPEKDRWSIYWADTRRPGVLDPPRFGAFADGVGVFQGEDTFEGQPILVRFIWSRTTTGRPRWEQAFSDDDGDTWETNWIMDFEPVEEAA
jgi:hypothetical protein